MITTNAHLNRAAACKLFEAGYSAAEIAAEYPRVWKLTPEGKLTQIYWEEATRSLHRSDLTARECGLQETSILMTSLSVQRLIQAKKARK